MLSPDPSSRAANHSAWHRRLPWRRPVPPRTAFPALLAAGLVLSAPLVPGQSSNASAQSEAAAPAGRTRIVMLGTGTPNADPERSGPAVAIVVDDRSYIVDCGPGVVRRAAAAAELHDIPALRPAQLRRVFLTHLHSDHTLGCPDLLLSPWVLNRSTPLEVWGPEGTANMFQHAAGGARDAGRSGHAGPLPSASVRRDRGGSARRDPGELPGPPLLGEGLGRLPLSRPGGRAELRRAVRACCPRAQAPIWGAGRSVVVACACSESERLLFEGECSRGGDSRLVATCAALSLGVASGGFAALSLLSLPKLPELLPTRRSPPLPGISMLQTRVAHRGPPPKGHETRDSSFSPTVKPRDNRGSWNARAECPALRNRAGTLYTLATTTLDHPVGTEVRVRGTVADASICMQGRTIVVESLERVR